MIYVYPTFKDMKNLNAYEYLCLLAIHKYLNTIFNNEELYSCIKLSLEISQQVFQHGPWMAHHIHDTNHGAFTNDALCAKNINLSPSNKQLKLHDSWFINAQDK
ncbi:5902_t:CDS:2 [Cetraspora pellucida]|uniref:5902_t:CDS:1 n=1 Tax=Cetraspora pellucida TaxID=1433469 RepID=A0A9N9B5E6_9GLOM|nr:5902_t:CDS:2 [Cetraspora pellucida]